MYSIYPMVSNLEIALFPTQHNVTFIFVSSLFLSKLFAALFYNGKILGVFSGEINDQTCDIFTFNILNHVSRFTCRCCIIRHLNISMSVTRLYSFLSIIMSKFNYFQSSLFQLHIKCRLVKVFLLNVCSSAGW